MMDIRSEQEQAGHALKELALGLDWVRISFEARFIGKYGEQESVVIHLRTGKAEEAPAPDGLWLALQSMRKKMYKPGEGTWFAVTGFLGRNGYLDVQFSYDEPQWRIDVGPSSYQEDLEKFPRAAENVPPWFLTGR